MPPLRILAVNALPLTQYDAGLNTYTGISVDVLCFIAQQTGLRYAFNRAQDLTVAEKIKQVQDGRADVFVPLSRLPERESKGLFSAPYYESHYAVIARSGQRLTVRNSADLAKYRVGFVGGVALEPILHGIVPAPQLYSFDASFVGDGLFQALRDDTIDVAVFSKNFFSEERFRHELFDLEIIQTLTEYPRAYSFYFSPTPQNQRIVAVFDRYLKVMDTSAALAVYEVGERQLIERFVAQRSQRTVLLAASAAVALLALASYGAMRRHRRLSLRLAASNAQILAQQNALRLANEALERLSETDGMTGLANRRHFDQVLAREHARRQHTGSPFSVLMIDVDHFKWVNDHYGHAIGDDYLRAVARLLERCAARASDLAARYRGEEFACVMPDTDLESARAVAARIRAGVAGLQLANAKADTPYLTVSIGVATLQGGEYDVRALVDSADAQLYAAKKAGRNRVFTAYLS